MKFINVILLVCIITVHTLIHIIMTDYIYDRCQTYQLSLGMSGYFFEVFCFMTDIQALQKYIHLYYRN